MTAEGTAGRRPCLVANWQLVFKVLKSAENLGLRRFRRDSEGLTRAKLDLAKTVTAPIDYLLAEGIIRCLILFAIFLFVVCLLGDWVLGENREESGRWKLKIQKTDKRLNVCSELSGSADNKMDQVSDRIQYQFIRE